MVQFLRENWGNLMVAALLAVVVIWALARMVRGKKGGRGCGCGCGDCPSRGVCHPDK